ncbi:uncharacterized protein Z518_09999 [Rhinocladiella mackenziei CBS 650.93]|uniref:Nucleoporin NUP37 n=1 Tax=Rhinocladiella mackenziei CBS 650.93 TaxID=1442369 RepID=A0A0D2I550_9EURO|nr:uncharacterized protein Z518_09999 [Rhinocladiella mackenziei CBS 650.93]KIX00934.1 hypothetical protein Z518_09999 [Rhinocladiella mackenziei CBS 650.93]
MDRSVVRQKERYQLSYELPHQAYKSHVYPRQSSNGSTVIIYGHEQGLRLIWYAGKPFKPIKKDGPPPKVNEMSKPDCMIIDLDEEDNEPAAEQTPAEPAEFEEEDEEVDPSAPYRDVIRYVDIPLGVAALRVAIPPVPRDVEQIPPESWPAIYLERIVIAVACADLTIRIISAPIEPPAPESQDISKMDVHTLKIFGPNSHQEFISDIAITHTANLSSGQEEGEERSQIRPQTRSQSHQKSTESDTQRWSLLVASVSCTGSGLLLVHQLPLQNDNQISTNPEDFLPIRRQYLRCTSMSAKLSFNPCFYPAERHSSLLITFTAASCVKLFQIFPTYTLDRRGSSSTADSASSIRSSRISGSERGKFLMTFLPSFIQDSETLAQRRKRVLDAQWIAGGRAIIALLEDGEWGIWDLEAIGPTSSGAGGNLIRGQANISGIQGGSITKFAIRSNIFPSGETKQKSSNSQTQPVSGSLAPMTPSTRKIRSEGLFQGAKRDAVASKHNNQFGTIFVGEHITRLPYDNHVVLSYGSEHVYVHSIFSFWKSDEKPVRLPTVQLGSQQQRSFSILPVQHNEVKPSPGLFGVSSAPASWTPNFLIQTDRRLILSVNPLSEPISRNDTATQTSLLETSGPSNLVGENSDQALLASGELDVDGMDRILTAMGTGDAGSVASKPKPMNLFGKSVGLRIDDNDDEDVGMASPTPAKFSTLKHGSGARFRTDAPMPQRRIFT